MKRREARGEQQLKPWKSFVHVFKFLGIIQQRTAGRFKETNRICSFKRSILASGLKWAKSRGRDN